MAGENCPAIVLPPSSELQESEMLLWLLHSSLTPRLVLELYLAGHADGASIILSPNLFCKSFFEPILSGLGSMKLTQAVRVLKPMHPAQTAVAPI